MNIITILCDTLRRDHVGAYHQGKPLDECWSKEAPHWVVPTPNMDRLAARGTTFNQCYCGSTPCMPARRDIYTGRYEFLERGWGPLEDDDRDLPRQVSGEPNQSISKMLAEGERVSYLVTDHFHLWEQGSGNYHMGYTGFEFIRGKESDAWRTDPVSFHSPEQQTSKCERHWRNVHFLRERNNIDEWFSPRVFQSAATWLDANHEHEDFYLHIDCFDPHEPLDPPEELLKQFDPEGYDRFGATNWPYAPWREHLSEAEFFNVRARYAANVTLVDYALGKLLDSLDRNNLWENTVILFTTDHGTFNGDHGRVGKLQTHEFDAVGHIPMIIAHPTAGQGETREQLVQLVDIYPTVLAAVNKPLPTDKEIHGVNLLEVVEDATTKTRDYAIMGQFGQSVSITDGKWSLHQAPVEGNSPLHWHSPCLAKFIKGTLGPYENGKRKVSDDYQWQTPTWLSNKEDDPNDLLNLAAEQPGKVTEMQQVLKQTLLDIKAPAEQLERLGLRELC